MSSSQSLLMSRLIGMIHRCSSEELESYSEVISTFVMLFLRHGYYTMYMA